MKFLFSAVMLSVIVPVHASAEFCQKFTGIADALEARSPDDLRQPVELGAGETSCEFTVTPKSTDPLARPAGRLIYVGCEFLSGPEKTWTDTDLTEMVDMIKSCPDVSFAGVDRFEDGEEHFFDYGQATTIILGQSADRIYLEMEHL